MTRLVLVRHEETPPNRGLARLTGHELHYASSGSDRLVRLTRQGRQRALAVGRRLSGCNFSRAYASEFARTQQMLPLLRKSNRSIPRVRIDRRLNKRDYGLFWNLTYLGVERLHPEEFARFKSEGPYLYRPPGGENYKDLLARVLSFLDEELSEDTLLEIEDDILVSTHCAVMLAFAKLIEGLTDEEVVRRYEEQTIVNGQIVVYERHGGAWRPA